MQLLHMHSKTQTNIQTTMAERKQEMQMSHKGGNLFQ